MKPNQKGEMENEDGALPDVVEGVLIIDVRLIIVA